MKEKNKRKNRILKKFKVGDVLLKFCVLGILGGIIETFRESGGYIREVKMQAKGNVLTTEKKIPFTEI